MIILDGVVGKWENRKMGRERERDGDENDRQSEE